MAYQYLKKPLDICTASFLRWMTFCTTVNIFNSTRTRFGDTFALTIACFCNFSSFSQSSVENMRHTVLYFDCRKKQK